MDRNETMNVMDRLAHPSDRRPVARPCDGKKNYYSPAEAEVALIWIQRYAEKRVKTPMSYYYCQWHDAYHLTSNEEVWS